jgi:hypothetical protein
MCVSGEDASRATSSSPWRTAKPGTSCQQMIVDAFDGAHLLGYAENLDKRYGAGTAQELRDRRKAYLASEFPIRDWTRTDYESKIKALPSYAQGRADVLQ